MVLKHQKSRKAFLFTESVPSGSNTAAPSGLSLSGDERVRRDRPPRYQWKG
ncbi:hypothetical protein [Phormidium sp. CCY1219]|uniref:hypothetical protein n=1 Tax=Phormidium sp. CCY1219 TaxID=2886104 RepID=UPI002D77E8F4|nr:hypothetical protein [Phormidium sp. CCY1219]